MQVERRKVSRAQEDPLYSAMQQQYKRRRPDDWRYSFLAPHYLPIRQDVERNLHACVKLFCERKGISRSSTWRSSLEGLKALDVGCGGGGWLLFLLSLGFKPANLRGVEILDDRATDARGRLPAATTIANANFLRYEEAGFDLILFSVVFSSILDPKQRAAVARAALRKLRRGGAIVVFDFVHDNPWNPDVRRVTRAEMESYFAGCSIVERTALLAPPIARLACRVHPSLYDLMNVRPLRSHRFWLVSRGG
jgi:SAM-dependent methyltransferase